MSNMCKAIIGGLFGVSLLSGTAMAACSVTYTFSNGTPADATQVNQNFSDITSCAAPTASPTFTGTLAGATAAFSGNVGIGMTPVNILDITQNQNSYSVISLMNNNTGTAASARLWLGNANSVSRSQIIQTGSGFTTSGITRQDGLIISGEGTGGVTINTGSTIVFATGGTEKSRFDSSGDFFVNATQEPNSTHTGWAVMKTGANAYVSSSTSSTSNYDHVYFYTASGLAGTLRTNGTTLTLLSVSDERVKSINTVQKDLSHAIRSLWIGSFEKWGNFAHTGPHTPGFGVLAQQAYSVLPSDLRDIAVTKPANESGIWMASSEPFAYLALWGVKDLYKASDRQSQKIASLEREVNRLRQVNTTASALVGMVKALKTANDNQAAELRALRIQISDLQRKVGVRTIVAQQSAIGP